MAKDCIIEVPYEIMNWRLIWWEIRGIEVPNSN